MTICRQRPSPEYLNFDLVPGALMWQDVATRAFDWRVVETLVRGEFPLELENIAGTRTYAGLFIITLATLVEEILLTRIFSVTMWYHFVFLAISVAMFGLTVGGLLVYLAPRFFTLGLAKKRLSAGMWTFAAVVFVVLALFLLYHRYSAAMGVGLCGLVTGSLVVSLAPQFLNSAEVETHLAAAALGFAVTTVVSFLAYLAIPSLFDLTVKGVLSLVAILGVISVPFIFSGVAVCLALTKFPGQVSRLYAADLSGAAAGCVLVVYALRFIDAPTLVVFTAALAGLGAWLFAPKNRGSWLRRRSLLAIVLIAALGATNLLLASQHRSMLELRRVDMQRGEAPIYEKWNSFSRVIIAGDPDVSVQPFGWGLSSTYRIHFLVQQLYVLIDSGALTVMTHYGGDFRNLDYLQYDITNFAHYFRPDSHVVVIGAGGGRDVLSALAFGQKSVTAIEMNQGILQALNQRFGEFTGHLDRNPRVKFVNDEARSYLARMSGHVDIIQASLVDTWAATTAGAFALAENSIYTMEAWSLFLDRLTPRGLLTFTRWYDVRYPAEAYRVVSLASAALTRIGVEDPRSHIIVAKCTLPTRRSDRPTGVVTILVSREPFSPGDLDLLQKLTDRMKFEIMLSPRQAADATFARLASGENLAEFVKTSPGRIEAPTDDSPFFLCNFAVRDVFRALLRRPSPGTHLLGAEETLGAAFVGVTLLTVLCIAIPWLLAGRKDWAPVAAPLFLFFVAIGLGFMLVEVSQLQRLMIFLGHPTYALSTVLFTLLLSSGLGSYSTGFSHQADSKLWPVVRLLGLLVVLALFGLLAPQVVAAFASAGTPARIAVAAGLLFPLGFLMGMAFPLGMQAASARSDALTPWLWGLNGAASVVASVIAFLIVLGSGIAAAFWAGFACYTAAFASYLWMVRGKNVVSSC